MARKGPQIEKTCVICGKHFKVFPSDQKRCCSKKCGAALRTKNGKRGGTRWSNDAKNAFRENPAAVKAREKSSPKGLTAAFAIPEGQKGPQNREALVWILVDPSGNYHKAINLLDWARSNRELFFPSDVPEEVAARRIASGFRAIASSMRGVASRNRPVQSYKGWRLADLPQSKKTQ